MSNGNWLKYIVCSMIIILAFFAGSALINLFNAESTIFGDSYEDDKYLINFSTNSVIFSPTDDANVYIYNTNLSPVDFDATVNDYEVLFNQAPCNVTIDNGLIYAKYYLKILNTDGTIKLRDTLYITLEFKTKQVEFQIKTTGGYDTVQILNTYLNNGFNIKVIDLGGKANG